MEEGLLKNANTIAVMTVFTIKLRPLKLHDFIEHFVQIVETSMH